MGARINIKSLFPQKADQGDAGFFGHLDRPCRGWADSGYYFDIGHSSFLDELEASPAAEDQDMVGEGEQALLQGMSDQFVQGVVAA